MGTTVMRIRKSLAVAGIVAMSLFTGTALTGAAYADSSPTQTVGNIDTDDYGSTYGTAYQAVKSTGKSGGSRIEVSVPRKKVRQGDTYTIETKGFKDGTVVLVKGIDGKTYKCVVKNGKVTKTFKVARDLKAGTHKVVVTSGGVSDTTDVYVVKA